jgi:hypothetical protein
LAWGCGLDSTGSGWRPVAGCCECGDESSSSCATDLVTSWVPERGSTPRQTSLRTLIWKVTRTLKG